jgi:hypothetical protein
MKKELTIAAGFLPQLKLLLSSMLNISFSFQRSLEIARFYAQVEKENELINDQRLKLCERLSEKNEKGLPKITKDKKNYVIADENKEEFNKKLQELFYVTVIFEFEVFKGEELNKFNFSPQQILLLEGLGLLEKEAELSSKPSEEKPKLKLTLEIDKNKNKPSEEKQEVEIDKDKEIKVNFDK